ncbi:hypothetical protein CK203_085879 [Vitis vinifera]|uniref:Uncharacterized protein n=1 Tax=Vitis vinifera TaxID=29760 RepID=A0A438DI40_VITVI|nr:hypothetical protein CK203_085879 [Vitis vinifera]
MDNLGWNSIPNSLNSIAHCSILPVKSGLCKCCEGVDRSARPPGGLGNRGGASGQRYEGLRLLAPFFNTGFYVCQCSADVVDWFLLLGMGGCEDSV